MLLASLHAQSIRFLPHLFATPLNSQWVVYAPALIFPSQVLRLAVVPATLLTLALMDRVEQPPCALSISASTAAGLYPRHRPECLIVVRWYELDELFSNSPFIDDLYARLWVREHFANIAICHSFFIAVGLPEDWRVSAPSES